MSLIVPVLALDRESRGLTQLLESVRSQSFADWEVLIVATDAGDPRTEISHGWEDRRIHVLLGSGANEFAGAVNMGLNGASGQFVGIVGENDRLSHEALRTMSEALRRSANGDIVYSDVRRAGASQDFLKPDFSPERLRSQFYIGNLTLYRRSLLASIGGARGALDGAVLYDLALRATEQARIVEHVRATLYTEGKQAVEEQWGATTSSRLAATRQVLEEHLKRTGGGYVEQINASGNHVTHRLIEGEPLVSVIIPTRGSYAQVRGKDRCLVVEAVRSVIELTTYTNYEFVIVIDDVMPESVETQLRDIAGERVRFVVWTKPFSFSEKMNLGVLYARGDYLLFLNDDVEVVAPDWMTAMLALAQRPRAGLVGAMLYFEDETIQHAGHAYFKLDVTHIGLNSPRGAAGPSGAFLVEREVAGVTCACAMLPKHVFFEAGGFSPLLPGNFNDVDLCMKATGLGYQCYWTPYAELYHFESKTRDPRVSTYEINVAWGRWEHLFYDSPLWPTDPHEIYGRSSEDWPR